MKKQYLVLATAALFLSHSSFSQKTTSSRARTTTTVKTVALTPADKAFVQDAINSNNEAMALAQMALQRSKNADVKKTARQFMNDHITAQRKLYAIAHIQDTVAYGRIAGTTNTSTGKLPLSDNLNSRRSRTVASIGSGNETTPASITNNTGNTVAGVATNQQTTPVRNNNNDNTNNNYGKNQTYNGITSIDNANGVNNANRTDVGSYSGRFSETNTVAYSQNPQAYNQGANTPAPANAAYNQATTVNRTLSVLPNNGTDIMPDFATRTPDTVRMTGMSDGFEQPGTNLTFPNSPLYSKTTPSVSPNGNTASDYGYAGVVVNNAQTNALNTAPYSNNEINGNIVQTGQLQGTSNPTAVINSSTSSLNNTQVAYNNSNANRADQVAVKATPNGTVVINNRSGASTASGTSGTPAAAVQNNQQGNQGSTAVIAGSVSQTNTTPAVNTSGNGRATIAGAVSSQSGYATSIANTNSMSTLRSTDTDAFDEQWAIEMNNNQHASIVKYQSALKATHNAQIRLYINSTLPLLQGHQFALKPWLTNNAK
jgi:predicted outer membrane protein